MSEEIRINANMAWISISVGEALVRRAIADGHNKGNLRWRVGEAQLQAIHLELFQMAPPTVLRLEAERGSSDSGVFVGVPYCLDRNIPDEDIYLEAVVTTKPIATIYNLPIPSAYGGVKEIAERVSA